MTAKTPTVGDLLYLDGFLYQLQAKLAELIRPDQIVSAWTFVRPAPATPEDAAAFKGNVNYYKDGRLLESELQWCDVVDLKDSVRVQAAALRRGNPERASWAQGCATVQQDAIAALEQAGFTGAWTLPGRLLLKPPTALRQVTTPAGTAVREVLLVPATVTDSEKLAHAILTHTNPYDQTQEG